MGEGSGRGSARVVFDFLSAIAGRVGSTFRRVGSGRVGSKKSDPWSTLVTQCRSGEDFGVYNIIMIYVH